MSNENGQPPKVQKIQVFPMVAIVPAGMKQWTFELHGIPTTMGGFLLGRRPVGIQLGLPNAVVIKAFVALCNSGIVMRRNKIGEKPILNDAGEEIGKESIWETDDEGKLVLHPVNSHFEFVGPPEPAPDETPQSRIITP